MTTSFSEELESKCHPKLVLGTVQLGLKYGIRNRDYKPPGSKEIVRILETAARYGVRSLDTAFEYGNSESLIGEHIPSYWHPRIITKTPKFRSGAFFGSTGALLASAYDISCRNLQVDSCDSLLIHDCDNLFQHGGKHLVNSLHTLYESRRVSKIGVSVYNRSQIERALKLFPFQMIQLPLNLADQRLLLDGSVKDLHARGIEIHVRSTLLQGALLMNNSEIPTGIEGLLPAINELGKRSKDADTSPLHALLRFALEVNEVAGVVIGVNLASQLEDICKLSNQRLSSSFDRSPLPVADTDLLNPGTWATRINI